MRLTTEAALLVSFWDISMGYLVALAVCSLGAVAGALWLTTTKAVRNLIEGTHRASVAAPELVAGPQGQQRQVWIDADQAVRAAFRLRTCVVFVLLLFALVALLGTLLVWSSLAGIVGQKAAAALR
jgi:hypothetical protein